MKPPPLPQPLAQRCSRNVITFSQAQRGGRFTQFSSRLFTDNKASSLPSVLSLHLFDDSPTIAHSSQLFSSTTRSLLPMSYHSCTMTLYACRVSSARRPSVIAVFGVVHIPLLLPPPFITTTFSAHVRKYDTQLPRLRTTHSPPEFRAPTLRAIQSIPEC